MKLSRSAETDSLSRRLAGALRWGSRRGPGERVLPGFGSDNFRARFWRPAVERAVAAAREAGDDGLADRLEGRRIKDLRDTYASHLLSAGVPLLYVSTQLGHADAATTARHYARWAGGAEWREPPTLGPGESPADLLSRGAGEDGERGTG